MNHQADLSERLVYEILLMDIEEKTKGDVGTVYLDQVRWTFSHKLGTALHVLIFLSFVVNGP